MSLAPPIPGSTAPHGSQRGAPTEPVSPIALRRFLLRLSQSGLAIRAGVSRDTIGRLERGEHPRLTTAVAIANALGCDVGDLFSLTNEERQADNPDALQNSAGRGRHETG